MVISKHAKYQNNQRRPVIPFERARDALFAFLEGLDLDPDDEVLLPAYIGFSEKEGSGVFDPITKLGAKFKFYRLTDKLAIDVQDLKKNIDSGRPKVLLLIHYFGFPDPEISDVIKYARDKNLVIIEDEAHAMFSDLISGICGRFGDAAIMSLHKMLPFDSGGLLLFNDPAYNELSGKLAKSKLLWTLEKNPLDYDLFKISEARRCNAEALLELIKPLKGSIDPLFSSLSDGVIPQTLPVLVSGISRDELYFRLNDAGYGVVSLYHTLIEPINNKEFPEASSISRRILNLPVHQDISNVDLEAMIVEIEKVLS